ncbi:hypothetical protein L3X38_008797 [Prunus dulcis]|uniref:Uncharacterized protein n=1 Tax=Prunus dulcis TaxID=3755 RepID=A0AAD4ZX73_PRUDU|nr:hypothetical protein L3X38_008797 [Prunus dulcis]
MVVEEAEMAASVPHLQVHEAAEAGTIEKLPIAVIENNLSVSHSGGPMNPPRYTSTILLKNGKLSDLIGELQSLLNGTGEQSEERDLKVDSGECW